MARAMYHLNNNIMCAVAIETTGPRAPEYDLWQVCVCPLDANYKPILTPIPFHTIMRPHDQDAFDKQYITQENRNRAILRGCDPFRAGDIFETWFNALNLKEGKKIMPLSYNWAFIRPFLMNWLQPGYFGLFFHDWYRDLLPISLYNNDSAEDSIEQVPYPKNYLAWICNRLGVEYKAMDSDTLTECQAVAAAYKRSLRRLF